MNLLRVTTDLFFPRACPVCGDTMIPDEVLCLTCLIDATPTTQMQRATVRRFLEERTPVASYFAAFDYQASPGIRRYIQVVKYNQRPDLGYALGLYLGKQLAAQPQLAKITRILPVPLHWRRRLKRGYNQSEHIARGVARILNIPLDTRTLARPKATAAQAGLQRDARQANVADAFALRRPVEGPVLLVDDVLTTGATLAAAVKALGVETHVAVVAQTVS